MLALSIRRDRTAAVLRKLAKMESDAHIARRILAIANALDGMSRDEAAQSAGMDRQTLRDWVIRYNEHGLDGLADRERDGRPPKLNAEEKDLVRICKRRFGKSLHVTSMGRILRELGLSRQKARPSHPQKDLAAQAAFKKEPRRFSEKFRVRIKTSASACSSRTRRGSARRGGPAISGGSAASAHRACATSASRSPISLLASSPAPTTVSPSFCPTPTRQLPHIRHAAGVTGSAP
jgi:transposase